MGFTSTRDYVFVFISPAKFRKMSSSPKKTGLQAPLDISDDLAKIIGTAKGEQVSRPQVIKKLWAYLKEHNLQDPENKQWFTPDKKMAKVFGTERMRAFTMSKFLGNHLEKIEGVPT